MGNNLPMFSMMSQAELSAWAAKHRDPTSTQAANIFPGRPRGYVAIVRQLADLASRLAVAKLAREEGDRVKAQEAEEAAEGVRAELPDFARPS